MKSLLVLGIGALILGGCSDTIVMQGAGGASDSCTYSLMYRALRQCVASAEADGMTPANEPAYWTYYR